MRMQIMHNAAGDTEFICDAITLSITSEQLENKLIIHIASLAKHQQEDCTSPRSKSKGNHCRQSDTYHEPLELGEDIEVASEKVLHSSVHALHLLQIILGCQGRGGLILAVTVCAAGTAHINLV